LLSPSLRFHLSSLCSPLDLTFLSEFLIVVGADPSTKCETPNLTIRTLLEIKVEDFGMADNKDVPIYICKRQDKVVDVFKGLLKYGFASVPVLDRNEKKFYGFLEMYEIVNYGRV
jgi:hypothetical protein